MISCLSTRRSRKRNNKYKASKTNERICRKRMQQHRKRCGRSERKTTAMRSVFGSCRTKVDKNKMSDAERAAELQRLQAGEERRGSNASQTGDCCF